LGEVTGASDENDVCGTPRTQETTRCRTGRRVNSNALTPPNPPCARGKCEVCRANAAVTCDRAGFGVNHVEQYGSSRTAGCRGRNWWVAGHSSVDGYLTRKPHPA
jgi:hypothetical protein